MDAVMPVKKGAAYPRIGALGCAGIFAAGTSLMPPPLSLRMAEAGESPSAVSMPRICAASEGIAAPLPVALLARVTGLTRRALFGPLPLLAYWSSPGFQA